MNKRFLSAGGAVWQDFSSPKKVPNIFPACSVMGSRGWRRLVIVLAALFAVILPDENAVAANNPLSTINADSFSHKSPGIKTEACDEGGQDLSSIHDGNYVMYEKFDFDSGVAGFKARIATRAEGSMEIRLDGPTGPLLGTCA